MFVVMGWERQLLQKVKVPGGTDHDIYVVSLQLIRLHRRAFGNINARLGFAKQLVQGVDALRQRLNAGLGIFCLRTVVTVVGGVEKMGKGKQNPHEICRSARRSAKEIAILS